MKISAVELIRIRRKPISKKKSVMKNKTTYKSTTKIARKTTICLVTHWNLASQGRKVDQRVGSLGKSIL